ncbi:hypothetical protein [Nonomuraea lactucae]|uniref:hypothetical protein n=1 Tax=Nonomuraea lactucae TaxID=2249762 RepID=UPI000DE53E17|nr:hypothetical protein [Nonomuraea lactucae]
MVVYATAADYAAYTDKPAPDGIAAALARASERIDELLLGAVYNTDDNEMPTDPKEREAIMRATCAQAAWSLALGDPYGVASAFKDVQIGSVRLGGRNTDGGPPRHAPDAARILHTAGLLPGYVFDVAAW